MVLLLVMVPPQEEMLKWQQIPKPEAQCPSSLPWLRELHSSEETQVPILPEDPEKMAQNIRVLPIFLTLFCITCTAFMFESDNVEEREKFAF